MRWSIRRRQTARSDGAANPGTGVLGVQVMPERMVALTDRGVKRAANQDRVLAQELPDGSILLAVADGAGGVGGGEVASAEAIDALAVELPEAASAEPGAALGRAFSVANERVRARAAERPELEGMASTLVAALVRGNTAWVANAGDSRAYLFDQKRLRQLTLDHSWVAEEVRAGRLTEEEAKKSAFRSVITRGVGVSETIEPDTVGPVTLPGGSLLLLCSDGLYRVVSDSEMAGVLESGAPHDMAERLIALANEGGGPDNISVVIFRSGG
jgi:serine/threonine protein phosphatase PrpC